MNSTGATGKTAPKYLQNCSGKLFRIITGLTFSLLPLLSACPSFLCKSSPQRVLLHTLNAPTGAAFFWKQARQISSRKVTFHNYYLIATFSSSPLRPKAVLIQPGSSNSCSQALLTSRLDYQEIIRGSLWGIQPQKTAGMEAKSTQFLAAAGPPLPLRKGLHWHSSRKGEENEKAMPSCPQPCKGTFQHQEDKKSHP